MVGVAVSRIVIVVAVVVGVIGAVVVVADGVIWCGCRVYAVEVGVGGGGCVCGVVGGRVVSVFVTSIYDVDVAVVVDVGCCYGVVVDGGCVRVVVFHNVLHIVVVVFFFVLVL